MCGESAENWNKENYMQFSVHLVVERLPYFLCWVVWTVLKMDKSCLMERIFQKRVLVITAANIFPLFFNLTPEENVALTSKLPPLPILERLGLTKEEAKRNVLKLSGGQQQRVAIARALASEAPIILADEPTGNLDEDTAQEITQILKISAHEQGKCVVVVTHSNELARQADVVFNLKNGKIQSLEK